MKLTPKLPKGSSSVLIGAGIALAVPIVWPIVAAAARPLAKSVVKGYLTLSDSVRELAAEGSERFSDIVAEAKAERTETAAAAEAVQEAAEA